MKKHLLTILSILFCCLLFVACEPVQKAKLNMGIINNNFDYMKNEKAVQKLVIQSERDKGYRFEITNKEVIKEIGDILSKAKKATNKSILKNDYILEVYQRDGDVRIYKYVVGIDKEYGGNFYSDDGKEVFVVSSRLDRDIIENFSDIRKPNKFNELYYDSIMEALGKYIADYKILGTDKTIGFDFGDDLEVQKYILSLEASEFEEKVKTKYPFVKFTEEPSKCDYTLRFSTEGYTNKSYKIIAHFIDNTNTKEHKYYIWNKENKEGLWQREISDKKIVDF